MQIVKRMHLWIPHKGAVWIQNIKYTTTKHPYQPPTNPCSECETQNGYRSCLGIDWRRDHDATTTRPPLMDVRRAGRGAVNQVLRQSQVTAVRRAGLGT